MDSQTAKTSKVAIVGAGAVGSTLAYAGLMRGFARTVALYDINQGLGRDRANTIILKAQFQFAPDTSFAAAAQATVGTAQRLGGARAARVCRQAFEARGIL